MDYEWFEFSVIGVSAVPVIGYVVMSLVLSCQWIPTLATIVNNLLSSALRHVLLLQIIVCLHMISPDNSDDT
jgi:hypothetical protein